MVDRRKTQQEDELAALKTKEATREMLDNERRVSDERYAIKLVQTIVFAQYGLMGIAVIGAILAVVIHSQ